MDENAYRQYDIESRTWLHRGRLSLIERVLDQATAAGRVHHLLEVGAGVGQNLPLLARYGEVDAAEIDQLGRERITTVDVARHVYTDPIPFELRRDYDVICALDVIEHLEDDRAALEWIASGLTPGGHVIASVPAYQWLFGAHDVALGHYRRYTKSSFVSIFPPDLQIIRAGYFNTAVFLPVAAVRQFSSARRQLANRQAPPKKQSAVLPAPIDRFLGMTLDLEARIFACKPVAPFGLSVFVLATKSG